MPISRQVAIRLAWLALVIGFTEFVFFSLLHTDAHRMSDFSAPYVSSRLWVHGQNPYDFHAFLPTWTASGAATSGFPESASGTHSVYPPITLPIVLPLSLLPWNIALTLFLTLGVVVYLYCVGHLFRLGWPEIRSWKDFFYEPAACFFIAMALGFAPVHSAIRSENLVLLSASLAIASVLALLRSTLPATLEQATKKLRWMSTGTAILSIATKPTTGIFLVLWFAAIRQWRLMWTVLGACALITAVGCAPALAGGGHAWLASYADNVQALFTNGGNADLSSLNHAHTDRIDLQLVLFAMLSNRTLSAVLAAIVFVVMTAMLLRSIPWRALPQGMTPERATGLALLLASSLLALGLLPVYSRVYSAIVLLPLLAWCLLHLRFTSARWLLLLMAIFSFNSSSLLRKLHTKQAVGAMVPDRLWDATLGGHTCWILLAIGLVLLWAVRQQYRQESALTATDSVA
jgi:hypothetical protein